MLDQYVITVAFAVSLKQPIRMRCTFSELLGPAGLSGFIKPFWRNEFGLREAPPKG